MNVQPLAPEEAIGLNLEGDDQIARGTAGPAGLSLASQQDAVAVFRRRRNRDRDPAFGSNLSRTVTGGTLLGGDLSPAPALGTRPVDGKAALPERDISPALALGTGRPRSTWCATASFTGGAGIGDRQGDRDLSAEHGNPEGHLDDGLERISSASPGPGFLAPSPAEDRGEDVAQPAHLPKIKALGLEISHPGP